MNSVEVLERNGPVILGQPHGGIYLPPELSKRLNEHGLTLSDTDWHINRLYDGLTATLPEHRFTRDKTPQGYVPPQILRERRYIIKEKSPTRRKLNNVSRCITQPIMLPFGNKLSESGRYKELCCCLTATRSAPGFRSFLRGNCRNST